MQETIIIVGEGLQTDTDMNKNAYIGTITIPI